MVFSNKCTLKDVTLSSRDVVVTQHRELGTAVGQFFAVGGDGPLTNTDIETLYEKLFPYTQTSPEEVERHVRSILGRGNDC